MIKARKFRRRADEDEDEDGEDGDKRSAPAAPKPGGREKGAAAKEKEKPVASAAAVPVLLSFAGDDEYAGRAKASAAPKAASKREKTKEKGRAGGDARMLSFEGDESLSNGTAAPAKAKKRSGFGADKGSGAHRLGLGAAGAAAAGGNSNVQAQAGEYTKEKLAELQRNTIRLGGPPPNAAAAEKKPAEPVVVLKGLLKPARVVAEGGGGVLDAAESKENAGEGNERARGEREREERAARLMRDGNDAESRLGLMGIGAGAESGGITHIPDAAAIAAAKAKRERLRQAQAAPDYIALAPGDGADLRSKLWEAAVVREEGEDLEREEDDSSADEAEVQGRMAFLGTEKKAAAGGGQGGKRAGGVFESVEERVMEGRPAAEQRDEDEEDEERRWEEEQLRKGFGKRVDEAANRGSAGPPGPPQGQSGNFGAAIAHPSVQTAGAGWGFGRSAERVGIQQQAEAAMRALQDNLQRMRETHARTETDLHRKEESLSVSVQNVSTLENTLAAAGGKYLFMQELRDHISVLCDFLQDKAPLIEELEEHMQRLHEERANALSERRTGDNGDELAEVEAAVGAAKEAFSRGAGTSTASSAASAAVSAFLARDGSSLALQLDEFGRDVNLQRRMESKRRAQARARRAARATSHRMKSMPSGNGDGGSQRVEGESSSEESESEATAYQSRREEVLDTARRTFGDASDEFAQLQKIKERLEGWKSQYPSAYRDAYVSLSAATIFAPYVRLELLQWDPLYSDTGFANMEWYKQLYEYGMPKNGREPEAGDMDEDLVPKLVEKVALPILHHEIDLCWDRLSTAGTRHVVAAVEDIVVYVPASSEALQDLLSAVRLQLAKAVFALEVPTWSIQMMSAVPQAARFAAQKFGTSLRLLRNIGMWKDVLAMSVLEKLALDELLSSKILPHLSTLLPTVHDAVSRLERLMAALTGVWLGSGQQLRPKLAPLVEYVTALTRAVEKRRDSGASMEDSIGLARRVKRMLVDLNEYDRAHQLARHFHLREAL